MGCSELVDNQNCLVALFSKDRPDRLLKTLPHLKNIPYNVVLIDDSSSIDNRVAIRKLCHEFNLKYHGITEQHECIRQIEAATLGKFITRLGDKAWSLGYNRNYSIIFGLFSGARKLIFMDDDVLVNPELFGTVFEALSKQPFVGVEITLMPDHSVLGHLYRAGGELLPQYVSGTFLGVDLERVSHYFLNIYNEDWIWLFLQNDGKPIPKIGTVKQLQYGPFENWESKILFQEYGEILWNGLHYSTVPLKRDSLLTPGFWDNILDIRRKEIKSVDSLALPDHLKATAKVIQKTLFDFHRTLSSKGFAQTFQHYFELLDKWRSLLSNAKSRKIATPTKVGIVS